MSEEEDNYTESYPQENNAAVMKNFFDLTSYVKKKIAYWQGFTLMNGKKVQTHEPIAPDGFIYGVIGSIDSVLSQHNSVSYIKKEGSAKILFENIKALNESIIDEPLFNYKRYSLFLEEYDHMLELFMGLVIDGHGKNVATALQAGVVSESQYNVPEQTSLFGRISQNLNKPLN